MVDVARHVRIFDKDPSDDLVDKRILVVSALADKYIKLKSYNDYFSLVEDIAVSMESDDCVLADRRAIEVERAIQAQSSSFAREGQDLQMVTCLLMAVLSVLSDAQPSSDGWGKPEILASVVWLGLSLQKPRAEARLEALRSELLSSARDLVARTSEVSRNRTQVPDPAVKITDITDAGKVSEAVNKGLQKAVEVLRLNAALDREELDLLWWALGEWSTIQGQPFKMLPVCTAAVTAGIEGASLLRRLPSTGHKQLVLRLIG